MLLPTLAALGGVAATRLLTVEHGVTEQEIRRAVRLGDVLLLRQGWVALPTADRDVAAAVRVGGALTCTSVLRRLGLWNAHDGRLHVRVPPGSSRLGSPSGRERALSDRHGVTIHRPGSAPAISRAVDPVATAVAVAIRCQPRLDAIATLDSALHSRVLSLASVRAIIEPLPRKYHAMLALVDGSAQSGLESKARISLLGCRVKVRSQVAITGVGHVDLLIGDRLVLELDGHRWHSAKEDFEEDRRRDLELTRVGYLVVRLSYDQVTWRWDGCEAVLLEIVRRREHLWPRSAARTA